MPVLKHTEVKTLQEAWSTGRGPGYVLDFSDRTFALYFDEEFGIDIDDPKYRANGTSKGNRLHCFLEKADGTLASRVMRSLWDTRAAIVDRGHVSDKPGLTDKYFAIVHRFEGGAGAARTDALDKFKPDETLDELIAAIQRDINANKPQAALDRLHTYCMKKFAHLIETHGGICEKDNDPLHSRVGKYIRLLEEKSQLQPISAQIMKSSISVFDKFNGIRNDKTFAHDNEIVGLHEARFIFDSVSAILRFVRAIEAARFGG
jgi:hypothetical protein